MTLTRRSFLGSCLGTPGLVLGAAACSGRDETHLSASGAGARGDEGSDSNGEAWAAPSSAGTPFQHGVASGDPLSDAVILWTRITPQAEAGIDVEWRMATDPGMRDVMRGGSLSTDSALDYTVHVDVSGLASGTTYFYQFRVQGRTSRIGRTKTLPSGSVERMRLAVASCANYPAGYFNAYGSMARADVDVVVHLGDYIYEYANRTFGDGTSLERMPDPPYEVVSLADYRARHAQYKTDPDLQELHRQHPMVSVWDDHELANDAFHGGAQNHQPTEGDFAQRKQAAERAYREWMPLRGSPGLGIYKSFACGDLLDLVMLDARLEGRDAPGRPCDVALFSQPERQLLGNTQEAWLKTQLESSRDRGVRWRLIGQQVIFAPLARSSSGCVQDPDVWDGYTAGRERVFQMLDELSVDNVVVLTGDAHASFAIDVASDPFSASGYDAATGRGSRLVEFVAPGVSSPGRGGDAARILLDHPHVKFTEQLRQGYILLDVTRERVQAEWYFVASVTQRTLEVELGAAFQTLSGASHLAQASGVAPARSGQPELAP